MGEIIPLPSRCSQDTEAAQARRERIGNMIRQGRGGLTQAQLGARVGVGQPAVSGWESGRVGLTAEQLWSIESSLGLEHGWLSVAGGFVDPDLDLLLVLLEASVVEARTARGRE